MNGDGDNPYMLHADLESILKNLQLRNPKNLMPIFESVVNSIQSIQSVSEIERDKSGTKGLITVTVEGEHQKTVSMDEHTVIPQTVIITDNGPGFRNINYEAFNIIGTQQKANLGCKGMGRTSWLYVFKTATVKSVYEEDGIRWVREFTFDPKDGVKEKSVREVNRDTRFETVITLSDIKAEFSKNFPNSAERLARSILHHCFSFLASGNCPEIKVTIGDDVASVNQLYKDMSPNIREQVIEIGGHEFRLLHVRFFKGRSKETSGISLCGNRLEVIPDNSYRDIELYDENEGAFKYRCYVYSPLLDGHVTASRSDFDLPGEERWIGQEDIPPMSEIRSEIHIHCDKYLSPYKDHYMKKCRDRLDRYFEENGNCFSSLVEYDIDNVLNRIKPDMDDETIFRIMSEAQAALESELLYKPGSKPKVDDTKEIENLLKKVGKIQKDNLARAVIHRELMLRLYRNRLDALSKRVDYTQKQFEYEKERLLHDIILPRGTDKKNNPTFLSNNLWMVDERIYYYSYIGAYSDKQFNQFTFSDLDTRPDIVVFGDADEDEVLRSVAIIEVKRPERYDGGVIDQVYDYVDALRESHIKDYLGKTIVIGKDASFFCYIICDVASEEFRTLMRRRAFSEKFGKRGYYGYNGDYNASLDFTDHTSLVADAERRNKVFFELIELNIDKDDIVVTESDNSYIVGLEQDEN